MKCPDCGTEISTEAPTCPKCGRLNAPPKKKTSPLAAGCGLILLIGVAISIFGAIFDKSNDDSSATSSSAPAATTKPYVTTAPALYAAYERNEVATQDAIGGRPVQVSGMIASIDEDFSGSPVLHLEDGNEFSQVGLTLADSDHQAAAGLRQGMAITVICQKMVRIVDSPQGSDCQIVPNKADKARATTRAKQDIRALETALTEYRLDNEAYPTTQEGLNALLQRPDDHPVMNWHGPYIQGMTMDPWGHPYRYAYPGTHGQPYDVYSLGADASADSTLGNWNID